MTDELTLPLADDFHVHVRQGAMLQQVAPLVRAGGVGRCLVMPNTVPPKTCVKHALAYRDELRACVPGVDWLMTLYLSSELTPEEINRAADAGITGVKVYPRGVTTHSDAGVDAFDPYYPVFEAMQACGLVLEIHGEKQSDADADICVMNAEEAFLPGVAGLIRDFPGLRIVLEHITTDDAVEFVKAHGPNLAATITTHHLELTVDDWAGRNHNFCKPVAKYPHDRQALRKVVAEGSPRFFLGSDSAPHPRNAKECAAGCAGVFTSALMLPYLADTFDRLEMLEKLRDFACRFGAEFYRVPLQEESVCLLRQPCEVPAAYGDDSIVPFRAGDTLSWAIAP